MWTAASLSSLADGILKVALPLVAVGFTRSPTLIAGLPFAFTLPWLVFALMGEGNVVRAIRGEQVGTLISTIREDPDDPLGP